MKTSPIPAVLRQFMDRLDFSMDEFAHALGYARASSIQRYLSEVEYKKESISTDLAVRLERAVVGKGNPPIASSEVWSLTGVPRQSLVSSFDPDEVENFDEEAAAAYAREHWRSSISGAVPEIDGKLGAEKAK